ncbi:Pyridoxamine 5'-phosphate oxidase [Caenispirillum salinarum AK4]|uniref:Pyridoxamine 5'-phosphate oxidase n=1 Tax=Caenispirillum salinarum AK4 TaxID=1238182 RepID=K9GVD7_9PROT|nr:pyridoxamine 5'-phosphate oxidase family protein [Caenispirillum salinarum]EKV29960.1 Pyridoxamine 5'-phosphate oxidase [Caenispirillum salinarum AK4]
MPRKMDPRGAACAGAERPAYARSPATTARRKDRMTYDKEAVHAVLDEGFVCHAAYVDEAGQARVHPTNYWRIGEAIYLHGGHKSGLMKAIARGERLSIAVTLEDGLVLAKSAFAHSMNYRCVMLYGRGRLLSDEEKYAVVPPFIDKVEPGRGALVRPLNAKEAAATAIAEVPLVEVGLKSRSGPPGDPGADRDWPVWTGVVPVR